MVQCLFVGLGGFIGAIARYAIGLCFSNISWMFPWGTLIVNFAGSFLIGVVASYNAQYATMDPRTYLFLTVGLCGGFTTFSTFSLETFGLLNEGRIVLGILYAAASAAFCIAGVFIGKAVVHSAMAGR